MVSSDTEMPNPSSSRMIQIARPPPHHATGRRNRAFLHNPSQKSTVCGVQLGRYARRRNIDETVRSLSIEPDHPVPQRLPIHPADLGRLSARGSTEHRRNRQQPPGLRRILRSLRNSANLAGRVVRPHRNNLAHATPSVAILNHGAADLGIPQSQALGGLVLVNKTVDFPIADTIPSMAQSKKQVNIPRQSRGL
jgi:hypothetical protein